GMKAIFDDLGADAVTVHPYLGSEAMTPFLERKEKGIFVLCRTSNPGAGEFQDLPVQVPLDFFNEVNPERRIRVEAPDFAPPTHIPLYQYVAWRVKTEWNKNGNCGLVVGATYPEELAQVRRIVGDMPLLIPGIGAQGGDLEKTVKAGKDSRGRGMIVNSSRGIIFASNGEDFAEAARRETQKLHDLITKYREESVTA
ncbi:orotidine-5'-phosphate decarboxylase, partial [Candidatus Parcubacteria bacterium]|nr:orotidine-5'-phosphate decarboxylase [Candidatus Parcubacteria bacterium]